MAKRILVPLDRSFAAEMVLPLVADAARGGGGTVRLLHVAPLPVPRITTEGRVLAYADQEEQRLEIEGLDYLHTMELGFDGVAVESVVRFGDPVTQILREAEEFGADLIAVTTVGRSGLRRAAFRSVAEQVFRKAKAAVLLYHSSSGYEAR
jgi:nucleotide-binding universal stress UspA family protein